MTPKQLNGSKLHHPAKVNSRSIIVAARGSGLKEKDIRKLLAGEKLARTLPDARIRDITKGIKLNRWSQLNNSLDQCDRKLKTKGLPDEMFVALQKAKVELMAELSVLTKELDEISKAAASNGNGQMSPHSFGPREQIGNMTAVQVNIGKAPEQAPSTDVSNISTIRT